MRRFRLIFAAILLAAAILALPSCSIEYNEGHVLKKDGFKYYTSATRKNCFAGPVTVSVEDTVVEVPDEVDGYKVIALGGALGASKRPQPFYIYFEGVDYLIDPDDIPDDTEVIEKTFELRLGKNVSDVSGVMKGWFRNADSTKVFHITVNVVCSEENGTFRSDNGKLYRKSDGSLVDSFEYAVN